MQDRTAPYPIEIESDRYGDQPYEYTLLWDKPETGGLPIEEYMIGMRRVGVPPPPSHLHRIKVFNSFLYF